MSNRDQQTLAQAIITQALRDLRSRSGRQRAAALQFLRPSPRLLAWASLAGLRISHLLRVAQRASR